MDGWRDERMSHEWMYAWQALCAWMNRDLYINNYMHGCIRGYQMNLLGTQKTLFYINHGTEHVYDAGS